MSGLVTGFAAASFLLVVAAVPAVRRWALREGLVARPGAHRAHEKVTPLGGGIALNLAIVLPIVVVLGVAWAAHCSQRVAGWLPEEVARHAGGVVSRAPTVLALAGGALLLHCVGLLDDRRDLKPGFKLLMQILVGCGLVLGFRVTASAFLAPWIGDTLSIAWIVVVTNTFNLLDNTDGLSAGVAAIVAALLAICGLMTGQLFVPALAMLVAGAAVGFLVYNFPPARIFMGDSGSLVLGYWLAAISLLTTYYTYSDVDSVTNPWVVLTPLVLFAVPLYDVASVVLIRLRERRPIWVGDRRHFSHRLLARGMSARKTVLTIYLATTAAGVGGLMIHAITPWQTCLVCGQTGLILLMIALLESNGTDGQETS